MREVCVCTEKINKLNQQQRVREKMLQNEKRKQQEWYDVGGWDEFKLHFTVLHIQVALYQFQFEISTLCCANLLLFLSLLLHFFFCFDAGCMHAHISRVKYSSIFCVSPHRLNIAQKFVIFPIKKTLSVKCIFFPASK